MPSDIHCVRRLLLKKNTKKKTVDTVWNDAAAVALRKMQNLVTFSYLDILQRDTTVLNTVLNKQNGWDHIDSSFASSLTVTKEFNQVPQPGVCTDTQS